MLQTFFTRRALKRNLSTQRNTWRAPKRHLSTRRSLQGHTKGHSKSTCALKALGNSSIWGILALKGHLGTQGSWALGHSDTWHSGTRRALGYSGTQTLEHLGTRGTRGTLFSRLFFVHSNVIVRQSLI